MSEETQDRRQKAAKAAQRNARLAEEMKANMRKRKGQKKARIDDGTDVGAADEARVGGDTSNSGES